MTSKNIIMTLLASTILASCSSKPGGNDKNDPRAPRIMQIPQMNIYTLKEGMGTSAGDFLGEVNKFQQGLSQTYSIDTNILNVSIPSQMTTLKEYIDKGLTSLTDIPDNKFNQTSPFVLVLKNKDGKPDTVNINENKLAKLNIQALILEEGTTFNVTGKPVTWSIGKINDIFGYMVEGSTNIYIGNVVSHKGNLKMSNGMLFLDSGFLVETNVQTEGATILHFKSPSNAPEGLSRKYITLGHGTVVDTSKAIGVNKADPSKKIGLRGITIDDGQTVELNDLGKDKTSVAGSPGAKIDVATPNPISALLTDEQNKTHGVTNRGTLKITKGTIIGDVTNNTANPEKSINKGVMLLSGEIQGNAYNTQGNFLISGGKITEKFENRENGTLIFDGAKDNASIEGGISNLAKSTFFIKTKNTLKTPSLSFDPAAVIKVALTDDASSTPVVSTKGTVDLQTIPLSLLGENEAIIKPKEIILITTDGKVDNLNTDLKFDPSLKVGGKTATSDDISIETKDGNKVILKILKEIDAGPKRPTDGSAPYLARTHLRDFDPRTVHGNDASMGDFHVSMVETDTAHQASFKFGQFHGYAQYSTTKNEVQELALNQTVKNAFFGISNSVFYGLNTSETTIGNNHIMMNSKLMAAQTKIFKEFDFCGLCLTPGFITGYSYTMDDKSTYNMSNIKIAPGAGFFGTTFNISKNFTSGALSYTAFAKVSALSHISSHDISFGSKTESIKGKNTFYAIGATAKLDHSTKAFAAMEVDGQNNQKYEFSINVKL